MNLVVTCSNKKRSPISRELRLGSVEGVGLDERFRVWCDRIRHTKVPEVAVRDLYAGVHWHGVQAVQAQCLKVRTEIALWVCSAGYGLLSDLDAVKPYAATFATGQADSVNAVAGGSARSDWWGSLARVEFSGLTHPRTILAVATDQPRRPLVVVLSEPYFRAVYEDLRLAAQALHSPDLLSVFCAGAPYGTELETHIVRYDARLRALVGGTLTSLNIRVVKMALLEVTEHRAPALKDWSAKLMATTGPMSIDARTPVSDEVVKEFLFKLSEVGPKLTVTSALRALRDSGCACEYSRFKRLFESVTVVKRAKSRGYA